MKTTIVLSVLFVWYLFCLLPARGDCVYGAMEAPTVEIVQLTPTIQLRSEYCSAEVFGPPYFDGSVPSEQLVLGWLWAEGTIFDAEIQELDIPSGLPKSEITTPIGNGMTEALITYDLPPGNYHVGAVWGAEYRNYDVDGTIWVDGKTLGTSEVAITVVPEPSAFALAFVAFALAWGYQSWRKSRLIA